MVIRATTAVLSLLMLSPAFASEFRVYEHNHSVVAWQFAGDSAIARYATPRAGLAEVGVQEGTILFEGEVEGEKIEGTAKRGCEVIGYSLDSSHATLRFRYSNTLY